MPFYIKNPVIVEAEQFTAFDNLDAVVKFVQSNCNDHSGFIDVFCSTEEGKPILTIKTTEGVIKITAGDWIIKGGKCEFYLCKPNVFKETYTRTGIGLP